MGNSYCATIIYINLCTFCECIEQIELDKLEISELVMVTVRS